MTMAAEGSGPPQDEPQQRPQDLAAVERVDGQQR